MAGLNRDLQLRVLRHLIDLYPDQKIRMDHAFSDVDAVDLGGDWDG